MWRVTGIAVARHDGRWKLVATAGNQGARDAVWLLEDSGSTGWSMLGDPPGGVPEFPPSEPSRPAIAANADGRFEVVTVGSDGVTGAVWNARQLSPGGGWSGWTSLGTPPEQETVQGRPALARNKDGRLELFVVDPNRAVWHRWQKEPGGDRWEAWQPLGSPGGEQVGATGAPSVVQNVDGRLELFVTDFDEAVWHRWQDPAASGGWSGWHSLGSPGEQATVTGPPSVTRNVDARLDLFVTARDGAVWHRRQDPAAPGGWSGWHSMERQGAGFIEVAAGALPDGRLVLWAIADFAGGAPNDLWRREQPRPGAGWQPWTSLADLFKDGPSGPGQIQDPTVAVLPESDVEAVHLFLRGDASAHLEHLLVMSPPAPSLLTKTMALRPPPEAIDDLGPQEQGPP